jgi:hypothetical protein
MIVAEVSESEIETLVLNAIDELSDHTFDGKEELVEMAKRLYDLAKLLPDDWENMWI